jgi:putative addiction module component (TIGR02574 family)
MGLVASLPSDPLFYLVGFVAAGTISLAKGAFGGGFGAPRRPDIPWRWCRCRQRDKVLAMTNSDIAELLRLPIEERLRLVEMIWDSIAADPAGLPLGDAQCAVIDERLAEHARNPDDVLTRDEVLREARRR